MAGNKSSGRKAAPAQIKWLKGTPGKDGRVNDSGGRAIKDPPPFTRADPPKPADLSPDASWLWDQVVEQMNSVGLLKPLDASGLEVMCETFARWREAVRMRKERATGDFQDGDGGFLPAADRGMLARNSQGKVTGPWIGIEERAAKDFRSWCSEFGITPVAEKNLVQDAPESNPGVGGGFDGNPFAKRVG